MIRTPYLLFLGDAHDQLAAKTAQGIRDWRPEYALGQYRLAGCNADLGLPDMNLEDAYNAGARTLVVGVANRGGSMPEKWKSVLRGALETGFDLASGLHHLLSDEPDLAASAKRHGRALHDVRVPSVSYPIADGRPRTGKRCLTVGTDCSVGKMYTSLALHYALEQRNVPASFRATGQTGILIAGGGVPLDAVVADFMSGSVEWLTPDNEENHWDIIEGQGSLFHVSFSGVTLALIHGGRPDALVLCHEPTRPHLRGLPGYPVPSLEELRELSLRMARIVNPDCVVAGIAVNTSGMKDSEVDGYLAELGRRMDAPAVDPVRHGAGTIADRLCSL
ncbi:MAG: N-acetyltransferase DgcN [Spirochaetales bacterium]